MTIWSRTATLQSRQGIRLSWARKIRIRKTSQSVGLMLSTAAGAVTDHAAAGLAVGRVVGLRPKARQVRLSPKWTWMQKRMRMLSTAVDATIDHAAAGLVADHAAGLKQSLNRRLRLVPRSMSRLMLTPTPTPKLSTAVDATTDHAAADHAVGHAAGLRPSD